MTTGRAHFDTIVVGGGPAGAICATDLAKGGQAVLILEKAPIPRYKTCGGGLVGRALQHLDCDLGSVIEQQTHRAEMHLLDSGLSFRVEQDEVLVTMIMRSSLDALLTEHAHQAGATVFASCALEGLHETPEAITVETTRGTFSARWVVAADGAVSRTAQLAGWPPNRHLIPALEAEIEVDSGTFERFAGIARFDFEIVPVGYAWVFPKASHLSVGCLSFAPGPRLKRGLDDYLARLQIDPTTAREEHGFVIPVAPRSRRLGRGRILLVGDAAGLADPVTCEGISTALASGRLAARSILEGHESKMEPTASYQMALQSSLLPELRRARLLARLLYRAPWLQRRVFSRWGNLLCQKMMGVINGETSYRHLVRPANLLKLR